MIDFTTRLTDFDGNVVPDMLAAAAATETPLTLGRAAANALLSALQDEQGKVSGAEHVKRLILASKVKEAQDAELSTADIEFIKERIAKFYTNSVVVGRAWLLLDPACTG